MNEEHHWIEKIYRWRKELNLYTLSGQRDDLKRFHVEYQLTPEMIRQYSGGRAMLFYLTERTLEDALDDLLEAS